MIQVRGLKFKLNFPLKSLTNKYFILDQDEDLKKSLEQANQKTEWNVNFYIKKILVIYVLTSVLLILSVISYSIYVDKYINIERSITPFKGMCEKF